MTPTRIEQSGAFLPPTNLQALPQHEKAREVARQFEALFTNMMMKSMRSTIGEDPILGKNMGGDIFTEMLDQEYARALSNNGNLGLAEMILKQIDPDAASEDMAALKNLNSNAFQGWRYGLTAGMKTVADPDATRIAGKSAAAKIEAFRDIINEASTVYNVDKNLIASVIAQESAGNPQAVSKAGAKGLMQIIDSTAKDLKVNNVFDPRDNILGGTKYLRLLLDKFKGDEKLALAGYNAGPSAVDKYNGIPPYPETQDYVKKVMGYKDMFSWMTPE